MSIELFVIGELCAISFSSIVCDRSKNSFRFILSQITVQIITSLFAPLCPLNGRIFFCRVDSVVEIRALGRLESLALSVSLMRELLVDFLSPEDRDLVQKLNATLGDELRKKSGGVSQDLSGNRPSRNVPTDIALGDDAESGNGDGDVDNSANEEDSAFRCLVAHATADGASAPVPVPAYRSRKADVSDMPLSPSSNHDFDLVASLLELMNIILSLRWPIKSTARFMHSVRSVVLGTER
jgi:hypothetical protein